MRFNDKIIGFIQGSTHHIIPATIKAKINKKNKYLNILYTVRFTIVGGVVGVTGCFISKSPFARFKSIP